MEKKIFDKFFDVLNSIIKSKTTEKKHPYDDYEDYGKGAIEIGPNEQNHLKKVVHAGRWSSKTINRRLRGNRI